MAEALQVALDKHLYFALAFALAHAPGLKQEQANYFEGMLAFHQGRFEDAKTDLITALKADPTALTSSQKIEAFETLGDNARLTHLYGACAQMYQDIIKIWGGRIGDAEQGIKEKRHLCAVEQHTAVQTIDFNGGPFTLERQGREYPVRLRDKDGHAEIDTGAAESVITESTAKAWGISAADATVTLYGYGGAPFAARPAVIPELSIGTAKIHNLAVFVTADENLYFAPVKVQLNALLGFPVASALGRFRVSANGSLTVWPASPPTSGVHAGIEGAPLWLGDSQLLVELETRPVTQGFKMAEGNEPRLFVLDTGSRDSYFTDHYLAEHPNEFPGPPSETARLAGAGGTANIPAYSANHLALWCGAIGFSVTGPHVLTQPQSSEIENYEGLIGQDVLRDFRSYTIDLRTMRFSIER